MAVLISEDLSLYLDQREYLEEIRDILTKMKVEQHLLDAIEQALADNDRYEEPINEAEN